MSEEKIILSKTPQTQAVEKVIGEIRAGHIGDRYPRNRPFLVVTPVGTVDPLRSKLGVTRNKGWTKEAHNWDVDERAEVVLRVSNRHMTEASVIIDIVNTKLEKNRYANSATDDSVMAHYMGRYADDITQALKHWADALKEAVGIEIDTSAADAPAEEEGAAE